MPAIVGTVNVNSMTGVLNIGDVRIIAPIAESYTFAGGGSFNSGDTMNVMNAPSLIRVSDTAFIERKPAPELISP
jgi:spore germination protein PA